MQITKFNSQIFKDYLIFTLFYSTILIGFFFNEESLGGAESDFIYHYKISLAFSENFSQTFKDFGVTGEGMYTRNSPIFWILFSYLSNILSFDLLRLLNTTIVIFISLFFFKCLKIKYKEVDNFHLALLSCVIFLSPTIRSLSIWPYPLLLGLLFFLVSIFNYLKFKHIDNKKNMLNFFSIFFLVLGSYIYPAFGIFFLFYLVKFYQIYKFDKIFISLMFFSFLLSIPFLFYVFSKNIFIAFDSSQGISMKSFNSFNFSNKILIISSMIFFFVIPIIKFKLIFVELKKLKIIEIIFILVFCLANIHFFNYPQYDSGLGGGFFHKISNILFKNNLLFFGLSSLSIIILYSLLKYNLQNFFLIFLLILYNPQLTIYHKYYDPLILIIFTTLIEFKFNEHYFKKKFRNLQLYSFSTAYLMMGILKNQIY